jgi:triosephosphate isomerase
LRRPLIIGNWKMNKTASEAVAFIRDLRERVPASPNADVVLAPPFTALESARNALGPSSWINLGAQNMHWETHGAFTGEVSAPMLRELGCRYVIVGHSERRTLFGERDENIQKKVRAALRHGLSPILCVGESLEEREAGRTESVVTAQLNDSLTGLTTQDLATVTIAYEPVWAIGTGRAASTEQAVTVHRSIRLFIETGWDRKRHRPSESYTAEASRPRTSSRSSPRTRSTGPWWVGLVSIPTRLLQSFALLRHSGPN